MEDKEVFYDSFHSKQGEIVKNVLKGENAILVCGRGFGKSIAGRGVIYLDAINYSGYVPPVSKTKLYNVIAGDYLNHLKKIHWESLEYIFTQTCLKSLVKNINRSEAIITLKGDLPNIMLSGVNDDLGDKIRGLSISKLFIDEFQDVKPGIWSSIKPAVDRIGGSVLLCLTPKGRGTYAHKFCLEMVNSFGWKYYHYTTKDNPKLPDIDKILREARQGLTDREYEAEYNATWTDFPGQIMDQLTEDLIIPLDRNPKIYETIVLGIDWGDIHPAYVVVGIRGFPYEYYLLEAWQGNQDGGNASISFDVFKQKLLEAAIRYDVHSTYPDVFQPGNLNYIYELKQMPHVGLQRTVEPGSEDYTRMRSLKVMPSAMLLNRLFKQKRLFLNKNEKFAVDQIQAYRRKKRREDEGFLDEPDPSCIVHLCDSLRYCVANIENALVINYGLSNAIYSPYETEFIY